MTTPRCHWLRNYRTTWLHMAPCGNRVAKMPQKSSIHYVKTVTYNAVRSVNTIIINTSSTVTLPYGVHTLHRTALYVL